MNFGSKYVYKYDDSDEECVSDEEFEHGMTLSCSDDSSDDETGTVGEESDGPSAPAPPRTLPPTASVMGGESDIMAAGGARGGRGGGSGMFSRLFGRFGSGGAPKPDSARKSQKKSRAKKKKSHWRIAGNAPDQQYDEYAPGNQSHAWRRADTNVVAIKFDHLKSPSNMHTGDMVRCDQCTAIFNHTSKLTQKEEEQTWPCEFCRHANTVDLMEEERPREEDTTYMLQPAPATTASGKTGVDESLVIFCVDTSGSMCVTTEVPGRVKLRGSDRLDKLQSLNDTRESQWMPGQNRNVTYVSRLQGLQAAVDQQLADMSNEHPNRRAALISFNKEVTVIGDGTEREEIFAGDKLNEYDTLVKAGSELAVPKAVKDTRDTLGDKVFELEEKGQTALGPALLMSVSLACQVRGSKVIICTDGKANVGLGSLENYKDEQEMEKISEFYGKVSKMAVDNGVSISVLSIKGTDCRLVELGKLADETQGQVNVVDPLQLTKEFGNILADPIIATNVTATFIIHHGLYIREDDKEVSKAVRDIGNVTAESEITFEFGVRRKKKEAPKEKESKGEGEVAGSSSSSTTPAVEVSESGDLPFQVQIEYTDLEGAKALRVLTKVKPVTTDRGTAEKELNAAVIGVHTVQQAAKFAQKGEYTKSRLNALMAQRLVQRTSHQVPQQRSAYKAFCSNVMPLENKIQSQQMMEVRTRGRRYSMSSDSDEDEAMDMDSTKSKRRSRSRSKERPVEKKKKSLAQKAVKSRHNECDDEIAKVIYTSKAMNSNNFK